MAHKAFHQREIDHLQEQNSRIVAQVQSAEDELELAREQINGCEERDAEIQNELQGVRNKIQALGDRLQQDRVEVVAKDEHVKVLGEQNNQMLTLLEAEENKAKDNSDKIQSLEARNKKLQVIAEEFDVAKSQLEAQVAEAKAKCGDIQAGVRNQRGINENLRTNIQNTEAKTRVDIEALGQALKVVDQKNLEYLQRINSQDAREKQLQAETMTLKEDVDQVRADIDALRKQLEGDEEGRSHFERHRGQLEVQIEALEVQADTLKKALSTAERANEQLQEENKTSADRCRETADKVYALMDSLRLNQVELKKVEAENINKDKKVLSLERQTQNLQAKISMECDAKVLAEQERKEAEQEAIVLKKKNKRVEETVTAAQQAQEKAEREIQEWAEKVTTQQTQNTYLASRIDSQEEEKNSLKAEIKKSADRSGHLVTENSALRDEIDRIEEEVATAQNDLKSYRQELEYIKREDVLDDAGRQRPILIQSNDSDLVEKLQINEFLYEAQQARNPMPPLIEKIAQLLAMLHEGQGRADQYLGDLSKSNGLVSALRQRNMALFSRTQMFESFKTRALMRYVMNLIEGEQTTDLHLDGLSFGMQELKELMQLLPKYEAVEKIFVISLIDNGLEDDAVNLILSMVYALPYLRRLDLKRNCISSDGIKKIEEQLRLMEGITGVIKTADGCLNVHSGNQLRLTLDVSEQIPKEKVAKEVDFSVQSDLSHQDADPFLATQSGSTQNQWAKAHGRQDITQQKPPQQAVPDPSTIELQKPTAAPSVPVPAGGAAPPVGLGGPGNVAALTRRTDKKGGAGAGKQPPDAKKRQAKRAKAAPPPMLDYEPMGQRDKFALGTQRPISGERRSTASLRSSSNDAAWDMGPQYSAGGAGVRSSSMDRSQLGGSQSMPALQKPMMPQKNRMPPAPMMPRRPGQAGGVRPPR